MDILSFLEGKVMYLSVFLIVLLLIIIILFVIQKRLKYQVSLKEKIMQKGSFIQKEVEEIKTSDKTPRQSIEEIDNFTRNFLKETFKINKSLDYAELVDVFKKKNKEKIAVLCQDLVNALYSGKKIEKIDIEDITKNLKEIVEEENPYFRTVKEEPLQMPQKKEESPLQMMQGSPQMQRQFSRTIIPLTMETPQQPPQINQEISQQQIKQEMQFPPIQNIPQKLTMEELIENKRTVELDRIKEKLPSSINIPFQREEMRKHIDSLDNEQITDAYKQVQVRFEEAYKIAANKNDKAKIEKLNIFRDNIEKVIKEYSIDHDIAKLAKEISRGVILL